MSVWMMLGDLDFVSMIMWCVCGWCMILLMVDNLLRCGSGRLIIRSLVLVLVLMVLNIFLFGLIIVMLVMFLSVCSRCVMFVCINGWVLIKIVFIVVFDLLLILWIFLLFRWDIGWSRFLFWIILVVEVKNDSCYGYVLGFFLWCFGYCSLVFVRVCNLINVVFVFDNCGFCGDGCFSCDIKIVCYVGLCGFLCGKYFVKIRC